MMVVTTRDALPLCSNILIKKILDVATASKQIRSKTFMIEYLNPFKLKNVRDLA
jgi:hypothetical protein